MTRTTKAVPRFEFSSRFLSDGSAVFNVGLWTHQGIWIDILEMPRKYTAGSCADVLTLVMHQFADCGSDPDAVRLAIHLVETLKTVKKS